MKKLKTTKMKTKFKTGQKVYDHSFGWGVVNRVNSEEHYPIIVKFNSGPQAYTSEGSILYDSKPTLSTKEYTLEGFAQEDQVSFEKGEMVAVLDYCSQTWKIKEYCNATKYDFKQIKKLTDFNK